MSKEITQIHTIYGMVSLTCGVISFFSLIFLGLFIQLHIFLYFTTNFALATLAILFGIISVKMKELKYSYGKIGMTFGIFVIIMGILQIWVWENVS